MEEEEEEEERATLVTDLVRRRRRRKSSGSGWPSERLWVWDEMGKSSERVIRGCFQILEGRENK